MSVYMKKVLTDSLVAAEDLTAAQYCFVSLTADGEVDLSDAATDVPIGVLLNKPDTGETAEVGIIGIFPVSSNAGLNEGDLIGTSSDGQADAKTPGTDSTEYVVGQVIAASGAAGELAVAAINCASPVRAA